MNEKDILVVVLVILSVLVLFLFITLSKLWFAHKQLKAMTGISSAKHKDRLVSIGILWAEIAHETLGSLSIVEASLIALANIDAKNISDEHGQLVKKARNATHKMKTILSVIKTVSHQNNENQLTTFDFSYFNNNVLADYQGKFERNQIVFYLNNKSATFITANALALEQVIINLLNNALDAVVDEQESSKRWVELTCNDSDTGRGWIIEVKNGGSLIGKNIKSKIFNPFFTTKDVGTGTGLGLSISKKIIDQQSGKLYLKENDKNTNFVIEFPCQSVNI